MATLRMSRADATEIYALTMAYLYDVICDITAISQPIHIMEMSPNVFCVWGQDVEQCSPIAICTYGQVEKIWTTRLMTGEKLTLLDKGSVWDVVSEEG